MPEVDCILFSLLILRGISDSQGLVWKCHPRQLYMVEVTLPEKVSKFVLTLKYIYIHVHVSKS